jgi:hypothetical protein
MHPVDTDFFSCYYAFFCFASGTIPARAILYAKAVPRRGEARQGPANKGFCRCQLSSRPFRRLLNGKYSPIRLGLREADWEIVPFLIRGMRGGCQCRNGIIVIERDTAPLCPGAGDQ